MKKIFCALPFLFVAPLVRASGMRSTNRARPCGDHRPLKDIVETAKNAGTFHTLIAALEMTGLTEAVQSGVVTVFAPTDEAFEKLPAQSRERLFKPENKEELASILTYHVLPGRYQASDLARQSTARTVSGKELSFGVDHGRIRVGRSLVVKSDIQCTNGIIHVVDSVLLPDQGR